ncbi:hypothetical protein EDD16DRAFT_1795372 [Pisolithus croceorrhizus]|nr:hypothetical protein EV401DRAFT_1889097 [Pisolithus croceorrhizus]KAI6117539.1 hypothetical protein EDD16DRAFT_1795372 [Pisolithus croceorrhizus]
MLSDRGEKLDNVLGHISSLLDLRPPRHYDKVGNRFVGRFILASMQSRMHMRAEARRAWQKHEELGRSSPQGSHLLFLKNRGFEKIPAHSMAEASANVEAYGDTPLSSTLDPENRNSLRSLPRYRPTRTATGMPGDDSEAFHLRLSKCTSDCKRSPSPRCFEYYIPLMYVLPLPPRTALKWCIAEQLRDVLQDPRPPRVEQTKGKWRSAPYDSRRHTHCLSGSRPPWLARDARFFCWCPGVGGVPRLWSVTVMGYATERTAVSLSFSRGYITGGWAQNDNGRYGSAVGLNLSGLQGWAGACPYLKYFNLDLCNRMQPSEVMVDIRVVVLMVGERGRVYCVALLALSRRDLDKAELGAISAGTPCISCHMRCRTSGSGDIKGNSRESSEAATQQMIYHNTLDRYGKLRQVVLYTKLTQEAMIAVFPVSLDPVFTQECALYDRIRTIAAPLAVLARSVGTVALKTDLGTYRYAQPRTSGANGTRDDKKATCSARAMSKASKASLGIPNSPARHPRGNFKIAEWRTNPEHAHAACPPIMIDFSRTSGSDDGMSSLIIILSQTCLVECPVPYMDRENVFFFVLPWR